MWYLIDIDLGVIDVYRTKKEIMKQGYKTKEKLGTGAYYIVECLQDGERINTKYIFKGKRKVIDYGFEWVFE